MHLAVRVIPLSIRTLEKLWCEIVISSSPLEIPKDVSKELQLLAMSSMGIVLSEYIGLASELYNTHYLNQTVNVVSSSRNTISFYCWKFCLLERQRICHEYQPKPFWHDDR